MLRLFLALTLLTFNLYACRGGFEACKLKIKHSNSIKDGTIQVSVLKNKRLIYSKRLPNKKVLKYDPFLSLYLVKDKKTFKHPFKINMHLALGTALVDSKKAQETKILSSQIGLNSFATYNEKFFHPSLLTNSCCSLEGIVTPEGIIQKEYIKRFIDSKDIEYSDIGIRVYDENSLVTVKSIDPFFEGNSFEIGDSIVELDSKKVKNSSEFMRDILFSKIGTNHKVKIKRGAKRIFLDVVTKKRYGGGYISDTFLEQKGIYFDEKLRIIKIKSGYKNYGFKLGDRLIRVNDAYVKNYSDVRKSISDFDDKVSLLFDRNGFQFFVNVD